MYSPFFEDCFSWLSLWESWHRQKAMTERVTLSAPVCALGHLPQRGRQEAAQKNKSPLRNAEDKKIPVVPPQFTACTASGILIDPQSCIGLTRPGLLRFQPSRSERYSAPPFFCLAPTGSSLEKGKWRVLVFINAFLCEITNKFITFPQICQ